MTYNTILEAKHAYEKEFNLLKTEVEGILTIVLQYLRSNLNLDSDDTRFIKIFNTSFIGKKMGKEELISLSHKADRAISEKKGYYECSFMALVGKSLMDDLQVLISGIIISKDLTTNRYILIFSLEKEKILYSNGIKDDESLKNFAAHIEGCLHRYYTEGVTEWLKKFDPRNL
ncbi:hypothetical protein LPTSP3_g31130 [Leptospira kobayashii]|uniref:PF04536 family protein n=1 Tax=Leptospira kobayashii TaxID=1917830 RepID=A0ABN6KG76_9LEPT|nr:hypothetical protein [Leptospira kobayashii]BDA80183.1 hypothetical protein LPTSP3_g31130 [Leptospira kobayashii]